MKNPMKQSGTALVTLLMFVAIATTVTTGAVIILIAQTMGTTRQEGGVTAYYVAEGGAENAILRLLRNPNYVGETLQVGQGTAQITVTGGGANPYVIRSVGTLRNFSKTLQATADYSSGVLTITGWEEVE